MKKNAKFIKVMCETAQRWKATLTSEEQPDVDRAKALLKKADKDADIFVVESPLQFYIAQAVIRGRVAKKKAQHWCETKFNTDPAFLAKISRRGGLRNLLNANNHWSIGHATSVQAMMLRDFMTTCWDTHTGKTTPPAARERWRSSETDARTFATRLSDVMKLYRKFVPADKSAALSRYSYSEVDHVLNFSSSINAIMRSAMSLYTAISDRAQDILNDAYDPVMHFHDVTQTEMIAKMIGCMDESVTWRYEIFHAVPAVMRFSNAFLILGNKPKLHLDGSNLHNAAGPAVEWPDGHTEWYVDGHELEQYGREIVLEPEKLTGKMIEEIRNEENRRIAIDKIGWGKYLADIGSTVRDRRENWVDNTIEALIAPPNASRAVGPQSWNVAQEPLRMLLSCRSTGRKYFLAIPQQVGDNDPDKIEKAFKAAELTGQSWNVAMPTKTINNCEDAQNWFAGGSFSKLLPYAKHQMRIVGAS